MQGIFFVKDPCDIITVCTGCNNIKNGNGICIRKTAMTIRNTFTLFKICGFLYDFIGQCVIRINIIVYIAFRTITNICRVSHFSTCSRSYIRTVVMHLTYISRTIVVINICMLKIRITASDAYLIPFVFTAKIIYGIKI